MTTNKKLEDAKQEIMLLRGDLLYKMFTIKTNPEGKRVVQQSTDEARLLGLLAISAMERFEEALETHRIVCICKEVE